MTTIKSLGMKQSNTFTETTAKTVQAGGFMWPYYEKKMTHMRGWKWV